MIYEFKCNVCGNTFEREFKLAERPDKIDCPICTELIYDGEVEEIPKARRIMSVPAKGRVK